ncbi:hypothetical protein VNI00_010981 [Paramarasmius palmivorus]|uniref:DUF6535 domain-containing protein n=1 Tax=Paramarasmius palmivorus TaxID=297713 RepID=A0AAW0CFY4_9AGAR
MDRFPPKVSKDQPEHTDVPKATEEETKAKELEKMRAVYRSLTEYLHEESAEQRWRKLQRQEEELKAQEFPTPIPEETPTLAQSWEKLLKSVTSYDEDLFKGQKEDIDTLLVFAGLFSAVVTAFLIESYQWLREDPADTTVILLAQISQYLNASQPTTSVYTPFAPEASSIRINCLWFLSVILSLTSALFGLLCKQWVREHERDTPTCTPGEALALRQLRRDSFDKWEVPSFLSALPILLEVALLFFFAGILDLLWTLHPIPFSICLAAVVLSTGLYFFTTFLPTIMVPRDQTSFIGEHKFGQLAYQFICPYKSPQAWAVYKLSTKCLGSLSRLPLVNEFVKNHFRGLWDHTKAPASSWSSFDLKVVRQFNQEFELSSSWHAICPKVYELQALQWAVTMFRDSPSMLPHLENILETLPPSVAVSAVLGQWSVPMWKEVSRRDIGLCLRDPFAFGSKVEPIMKDPALHHSEGIELLFLQQHLVQQGSRRKPGTIFPRKHYGHSPDPTVRKQNLEMLQHLEDCWRPCPGYDEERHDKERMAFVAALARHIKHAKHTELLTSKRGQAFIQFIHNEIIVRRLYRKHFFWDVRYPWQQAIIKVQRVGKLPPGYFAPIPGHNEDPPASPQLPLAEPIRYSVDTDRSTQGHITVLFEQPSR